VLTFFYTVVYLYTMKSVKERFWEKVQIGGSNECWPWRGSLNPKDYGRFLLDGKIQLAHRVAWILVNSLIPEGMCILHHCDNPPCCNVSHLFMGTKADNARDMYAKGRDTYTTNRNRGEQCSQAKLTDVEVLEIRRLWAETSKTQGEIGKMFGVSIHTISAIICGKIWTWLK